jgi:hypothetical protein
MSFSSSYEILCPEYMNVFKGDVGEGRREENRTEQNRREQKRREQKRDVSEM